MSEWDDYKYSRVNRYWGPFRQRWYSICSIHGEHDEDCNMCTAGHWCNVHVLKVSHWFHDHHYNLWYWWANRHRW